MIKRRFHLRKRLRLFLLSKLLFFNWEILLFSFDNSTETIQIYGAIWNVFWISVESIVNSLQIVCLSIVWHVYNNHIPSDMILTYLQSEGENIFTWIDCNSSCIRMHLVCSICHTACNSDSPDCFDIFFLVFDHRFVINKFDLNT